MTKELRVASAQLRVNNHVLRTWLYEAPSKGALT
jgi:hypothetical protein